MLKFILVLLFLITLYVLWRWVAKQKINAAFGEQRQALSQLVQNPQEEHELSLKLSILIVFLIVYPVNCITISLEIPSLNVTIVFFIQINQISYFNFVMLLDHLKQIRSLCLAPF